MTSAVLKKLFKEYMKRTKFRRGLAKRYTPVGGPKELTRLKGLSRDMIGTYMTSGGIKTLFELPG